MASPISMNQFNVELWIKSEFPKKKKARIWGLGYEPLNPNLYQNSDGSLWEAHVQFRLSFSEPRIKSEFIKNKNKSLTWEARLFSSEAKLGSVHFLVEPKRDKLKRGSA